MTQQFVYGRPVIDFVTTAVQVCLVLEHIEKISREEFADKMLNLLPQLYVQIRQIDVSSQESSDGFLERFVTEDEYNTIADNIKRLLGSDDAYLEVFVEDMQYSDKPITQFISENLADKLNAHFIELDSENSIYRLVLEDKINYIDITNPLNNSIEEDIKRRDLRKKQVHVKP